MNRTQWTASHLSCLCVPVSLHTCILCLYKTIYTMAEVEILDGWLSYYTDTVSDLLLSAVASTEQFESDFCNMIDSYKT